jgi:hypothetical protein
LFVTTVYHSWSGYEPDSRPGGPGSVPRHVGLLVD